MKKIGKYIVCGLLGKGGMSTVYKARLPFFDKIVALKLLSPHPNLTGLLGPDALKGRFISEAATIASLSHPNIIEVLESDFDCETPFFTMEYYCHDLGKLIGESYRADLPCRILSLDKTIHYCRQLLAGLLGGLDHLVAFGWIHGHRLFDDDMTAGLGGVDGGGGDVGGFAFFDQQLQLLFIGCDDDHILGFAVLDILD